MYMYGSCILFYSVLLHNLDFAQYIVAQPTPVLWVNSIHFFAVCANFLATCFSLGWSSLCLLYTFSQIIITACNTVCICTGWSSNKRYTKSGCWRLKLRSIKLQYFSSVIYQRHKSFGTEENNIYWTYLFHLCLQRVMNHSHSLRHLNTWLQLRLWS